MYIDGLPIWGVVGKEEDKKFYIYTHKKFEIGYNGKQIVDVNVTPENKETLQVGAKLKFTYEVTWKPSNVKFEDRFDKYLDPNFFQHRVRILEEISPLFRIYLSFYSNFRFIGLAYLTAS
jgi:transmembrane 9 superfamily protein 3